MKKTIKRGIANAMYKALSELPLGHLASEDLEKVMDNMVALSAPFEHHQKLMQELGKRLYNGVDEERIQKFNTMLMMFNRAEGKGKMDIAKSIKETDSADLWELLQKQNKVEASLLNKDVEVELNEIDRKTFIKAILKGKPDIAMAEFDLFADMYVAEEKEETAEDFSELDELLND